MDLRARTSKRQFNLNFSYFSLSLLFPRLRFADLPILSEALCLPKVFVTPKTFSESSSLILERKTLRLPSESFSIFVFLPQFWRSIHLPRKIYCCSVFISLFYTWTVRGKVFPLLFVCLCWASENFSVSATLSEVSDGLSPSVKFHCGKLFWLDGLYGKCISV